jgi:hypothetical protein
MSGLVPLLDARAPVVEFSATSLPNGERMVVRVVPGLAAGTARWRYVGWLAAAAAWGVACFVAARFLKAPSRADTAGPALPRP